MFRGFGGCRAHTVGGVGGIQLRALILRNRPQLFILKGNADDHHHRYHGHASSPFFCSFSVLQVLTLKQWLYLEILTTFSPSNHLRTDRPLVSLQIASSLKGEKRPIFNLSLYIISYIYTSSSGKYFISTPNHIKPSCTGRKNGSMSPFWPAFALYQSAGTQTGDYHHHDDLLWSHTF